MMKLRDLCHHEKRPQRLLCVTCVPRHVRQAIILQNVVSQSSAGSTSRPVSQQRARVNQGASKLSRFFCRLLDPSCMREFWHDFCRVFYGREKDSVAAPLLIEIDLNAAGAQSFEKTGGAARVGRARSEFASGFRSASWRRNIAAVDERRTEKRIRLQKL